jgi:hypothetical protein
MSNPPPFDPGNPGNPADPNNPFGNNPGTPQTNQPNPWQQQSGQNWNTGNPNPPPNPYNQNPFGQNPYNPNPFPPPNPFLQNNQLDVPNATGALVLGICSIVFSFCYGAPGLIMAIIGMVLASKGNRLYEANPSAYKASSYNNLKAGRICSIIGLIIGGLFTLLLAAAFIYSLSHSSYYSFY